MKIEKLKRLPSGKYKIFFDNDDKLITYDDVIIKNKLLYNKEVDDDVLEEVNMDTQFFNIYNKVLNYIVKRKRSIKEIREYLSKFELDKENIDTIIDTFKDNGLLNDLGFAKSFIADKIYLSNIGPNKIKDELLKHDIDEYIIDDIIDKIPNDVLIEKLEKIITKKINSNHNKSNYMLKQKLVYELSNNGFDKEMIINIFDKLSTDDKKIIELEYNKIYNKLSKKYQGSELNNKIKQKLYQKGFSNELINEIQK